MRRFMQSFGIAAIGIAVALLSSASAQAADAAPRVKILFLGEATNGSHRPADRFKAFQPVMAQRGIDLVYTDKMTDFNDKNLEQYAGLMIYSNITRISPEQEKALLDYVESGHGFIPLHCASYCFQNSPKYIALVGAQFQRHNTGTFTTELANTDHPILKDFQPFRSWDETYVHTKHNEQNRTVLEYRAEGQGREPWTWVRTQGKGRVFYTAWGHDDRTWGNVGFHDLVERGTRWSVAVATAADDTDPAPPATAPAPPKFADRPEITPKRTDVKPLEFADARVPLYRQRGGQATQDKAQQPLEPDEEVKHFVTPVGFELKLFAADKDFGGGKPIALNWDDKGRLWVCVTTDYPSDLQPEGRGHDKILICEDTDGDGRADKFSVFADKLSLPTSIVCVRGGAIVHQPPLTLFLKDTDGDGVADQRDVLIRGWTTGDTHAVCSNLRYGLDNWIYGIVGYSGLSNGTAADGARVSARQAFYRFRPDGTKFEFIRSTNNNSWGVGISEEGFLFGSTANGNPSVYVPIPSRYYEAVRGWSTPESIHIGGNPNFAPITDAVRQVDQFGRFTAGAGHAVYTARNYPMDYWNRTAFVSEPTGHLLATFVLEPQGASFRSRPAWNLAASDDEWSSPIVAEVGPDGNIWMIDWYNFIIQHNPTPQGFQTGRGGAYVTPLRDHTHGRIYRLVYTGKDGKPTSQAPTLDIANSPDEVVAALRHENMLWRLKAQKLIVERGKTDLNKLLFQIIADPSVDQIGLNAGAINALWTLHGLGSLDGKDSEANSVVYAALKHKSPGVRRNAALVLPRTEEAQTVLLDSGMLQDTNAQARLAAFEAVAEMPASDRAAGMVVRQMFNDTVIGDAVLLDGVTAAAARQEGKFFTALAKNVKVAEDRKTNGLARVTVVARHIGRSGEASSISPLFEVLGTASNALANAILTGFDRGGGNNSQGWPANRRATLTAEQEETLFKLSQKLPTDAKSHLVALATSWGTTRLQNQSQDIAAGLLATIKDEKAKDADRVAAARRLIEFKSDDEANLRQIAELIDVKSSPELASGVLDALTISKLPAIGKLVLDRLSTLTPAVKPAAMKLLLTRAEWTTLLLDAVDADKASLADLTLDQKQMLLAYRDTAIADRAKNLLSRGGALPNADRQKVIDELVSITEKKGDADLGKQVFTKTCAKCHTHSGEGAKIGPDLTGMAVHPKAHLLMEILDPSRSVEGTYRIYKVITQDGRVFSGLLTVESATAIELIDSEAKKHEFQRSEIEAPIASNKSLMPEGFEKQLSKDDLTNLLEFLTKRGKYLPLPLDKVATSVSTKGMFNGEDSQNERLIFADWGPKTFENVPFQLIDPVGDRVRNVIVLYSPNGTQPPTLPKSVKVAVNGPAKAIHMLSGVSGWGYTYSRDQTVSLIVRLHYADGKTEDHPLKNGVEFADYIRRQDVPGSKFAFLLREQQIRYLSVTPEKADVIKEIEFVKGPDQSAPIIMAVTVENRE